MSDPASLSDRLVNSAAWSIGLRFASRGIGLASTVILTRMLLPEDFGIIALATMVVGAVELLSAFNFQIWLVRHPDPTAEHYNTLWSLSVLRGLITAAVLLLAAYPLAGFFDEPQLAAVIHVLVVTTIVNGLQNPGIVDFQRDLRFDREFRLMLTSRIVSAAGAIGSAVYLQDYRALLVGLAIDAGLRVILSYTMHPFRPRVSLAQWRSALHFSKWLLVGDVIAFLYERVDRFLLGKLAASGALGLYTFAHEISNLTSTELVMPVRRVLLPGYATLLGEPEALKASFVSGFALIVMIGVPCAVGLGLIADPLVRLVFNANWWPMIPILQALVLYAVTSVMSANIGPLLIALERTRLLASLSATGVIILIPTFIACYKAWGLTGAALALGLTDLVLLIVGLTAAAKYTGLRWRELIRECWRVVLATAAMGGVCWVITTWLRDLGAAPLTQVVCIAAAGAATYVATVWACWWLSGAGNGPERNLINWAASRRAGSATGQAE